MSVFVDTSALYALLVSTESDHAAVATGFQQLVRQNRELVTTNYVLLETSALLQSRFGLPAVQDLNRRIVPLLRVRWIREEDHRRALDALIRSERRGVSLVDWTSFGVMRADGIRQALALDEDFAAQGFRVLPGAR